MTVDRLSVGLPDILPVDGRPDPRIVGLVDGQLAVLAHLLRGRSCFVDAVAGTGKSVLARIYCDMRLAAASHPIRFWMMGPAFEPSDVDAYSAYAIGHHEALLADVDAARLAAPADEKSVLVVDEATLVGPELERRFSDFDQVVLFGDTTQEVYRPGYHGAAWDISDPRIKRMSLGTSLRGLNETRFAATSYLGYAWSLDEFPVVSQPYIDHLRFASCGDEPGDAGLSAYLRASRNALLNPQTRCAVLMSDAGGADVVRDLLYASPFKRPLFKVVDPADVQGFETDIAILSSGDIDALVSSAAEAFVYLRMVMGRSRSRTEVIVPQGARGLFTRLIALFGRYNYGFAPLDMSRFGGFVRALSAVGLSCRPSSEGVIVFRGPSPDRPADKGRDLAVVSFTESWSPDAALRLDLSSQRGLVRIARHPDALRDGIFDPEEPWFATLIEGGVN